MDGNLEFRAMGLSCLDLVCLLALGWVALGTPAAIRPAGNREEYPVEPGVLTLGTGTFD